MGFIKSTLVYGLGITAIAATAFGVSSFVAPEMTADYIEDAAHGYRASKYKALASTLAGLDPTLALAGGLALLCLVWAWSNNDSPSPSKA